MNAYSTVLSMGQMGESSDKNYLSERKKSKNTEKGKTSKKNRIASISRSIQDIISATLSPSDDEDKSNLISIGGPAGDFKEQHHPSAIKKKFSAVS